MAGLVPAVRHRCRVSDEAGPWGQRRKLDVRLRSGDAEAEIQRASAGIKHQCGIQQVGFTQDVSTLDDHSETR